MAIDFPSAPTLGLEFTAAGIVYIWNGQGWAIKPFAGEAGGPVDAYTKTEAHWYFVDVAGDTMTGGLTIASPTYSSFVLNAPAGTGADFYGQNAGKNRWLMRLSGSPAESGSNAGSDFMLTPFHDDGTTFLGTVMTAKRADLSVDFGGGGRFNSDLRVQRTASAPGDGVIYFGNGSSYLYETAGTFRFTGTLYSNGDKAVWNTSNFNPNAYLPIAGGTITGNLAVNGTLYTVGIQASGNINCANLGATGDISVGRTLFTSGGLNITGVTYFTGDVTIITPGGGGSGNLGVYGSLTVSGNSTVGGQSKANVFISEAGNGQGIIYFGPIGNAKYLHFDGAQYVMPNVPVNATVAFYAGGVSNRFSSDGYIQITTLGLQPGGGLWGAASDSRIKTVTGDYDTGLDAIKQLNPVRYVYKGNDVLYSDYVTAETAGEAAPRGTPDPRSSNHSAAEAGTEYIGLVAQAAKSVMPEMVTLMPGEIDGAQVSDIHVLNGTALIYALVNACKELAARVETLEAAAAQP